MLQRWQQAKNHSTKMDYLDIIILIFGISYSFLIIHLIENGMQINLQLYFLIVAAFGLVAFALYARKSSFAYLNWGFLSLPIFITSLYNLINLISWKINNREFRLRIIGSRNLYKGNITWTDKAFSFLLIMSIFIWPISIALVLKKIM